MAPLFNEPAVQTTPLTHCSSIVPSLARALIAVRAEETEMGVTLVKVSSTTELALLSVDFFAIALTVVVEEISKGVLKRNR